MNEQVGNSSEEFAEGTLNALSAQVAIIDESGVILKVNDAWRNFAKNNGVNEDIHSAFEGSNYLSICESASGDDSAEASQVHKGILSVLNGEIPLFTQEYPCHSPKEQRWFIVRITRFKIKNQLRVVIAHENITARKLAEDKVLNLLREKEIILKEVHHRLKNNMSNIEGLLYLQMNSSQNEETKAALLEAIKRVKSMGVLYEQFMESDNYNYPSVKTYVENLLDVLISHMPSNTKVTLHKNIDDFQLSQNKLLSMGIIINELFTNISKYAFADRKSGHVDVILSLDENKDITLEIDDDGVGLPSNFDINRSKSLGTMLAKNMAQQLDGSLRIQNSVGTKAVLKFNASNDIDIVKKAS